MRRKTIEDLPQGALRGRVVALRLDLNVPVADGVVQDDTRIDAVLPTLRRLREAGARIVMLSHFGRPKDGPDPRYSLAPVATRLAERLEVPVHFLDQWRGPAVDAAVAEVADGGLLLLENTRFDPGETANDAELGAEWARWADVYVNDAFGTAHRAHASTEALPRAVRAKGGEALAGLLMERELRFLGSALSDPERPFVAVLGGAKISGKIDVVQALLDRVDRLIIGGAMANTFFLALGLETGDSLVEQDRVPMAADLLARAGERLLLPVDCRVSDVISPEAATRIVERTQVEPGDRIGDIGPATETLYGTELARARTIVWNGPMGVFEMAPFAQGTLSVAESIAEAADRGALAVVGGGDSALAAEVAGVSERMTHVSTGGGASLELLAGETLPGVDVLTMVEGT
ncbi:MAG: phosphoglycerate kinase [Gemmatimonadota bacterium]